MIEYRVTCDRCGHEITGEDKARKSDEIRRELLSEIGVVRNGRQEVALKADLCDGCHELIVAIARHFSRGVAVDKIIEAFGKREVEGRGIPFEKT